MRMIDADALIESIKAQAGMLNWMLPEADEITDTLSKGFIEQINKMPTVPQWIPIEERPPKFGEDVLMSYRNGVCVDWLTQSEGNAYFFISGVAIQDIDAWMPLPEPYKENRNDER